MPPLFTSLFGQTADDTTTSTSTSSAADIEASPDVHLAIGGEMNDLDGGSHHFDQQFDVSAQISTSVVAEGASDSSTGDA